jgi:peptide/nickel transport system permease protein
MGLILGISVLVFFLVRVIPGDVVDVLGGDAGLTEEMQASLREELGLTLSWPAQFAGWVGGALTGEFGLSLRFHRPVTDLIAHALPTTLTLSLYSFVLGLGLGIGVAVAAVLWPSSPFPALVNILNVWSIAMPTFCAGLIGVLIFVLWLEWMPLLGNMLIPSLVIGVDIAGQIAKPLHEDLKETLSANFVRTARAKGLTPVRIVARHVLPNSLAVVLALSGIILAGLVGGTITMEVVFGLPGIGKLALDSILGRDYPLIQAVVLFLALSVVVINALTDLTARLIDPRLGR